MNALKISPQEQIKAMLEGTLFELLQKNGKNPWQGDFRRFITVDRDQLRDFLMQHPEEAIRYFDKFKNALSEHDTARISHVGPNYIVAWMDHGTPRDEKIFTNIADAVVEHVLISHGKY